MMNQRVIFYFLLVVFILLVVTTILKVYVQGRLVRESFTAGTATTTQSVSMSQIEQLKSTYQSEIQDLSEKIVNLERELGQYKRDSETVKENANQSIAEFDEKSEVLMSSLGALGSFHDTYSQELQRLLQKNLNYSDPAYQARQEVQESRIKALEKEIADIEVLRMKVQKKKDNLLRSIVCRANSSKLNVQPIMSGPNPTGTFLIFLNDKCLTYSAGETFSNADESVVHTNITDTLDCDVSMSTQAFELEQINNFQEYNKAIKYEENSEKKLVMKNDDIYYPFYLVHPVGELGKCLYLSDDNHLYIKTIEASANARFRTSNSFAYGSCARD